jgi:hypothetical protein
MHQFRRDRARVVARRNRGRGFRSDFGDARACRSSGVDEWYRGAEGKTAVCSGVDERERRRVVAKRRQWRSLGDVYAV